MGDFLGGNSSGGNCPVGVFWKEIFLEPFDWLDSKVLHFFCKNL